MPFLVQFWSRMQSKIVFCGSIEGKAGNRCFPTSRDRRTVFGTVQSPWANAALRQVRVRLSAPPCIKLTVKVTGKVRTGTRNPRRSVSDGQTPLAHWYPGDGDPRPGVEIIW